MSVFIQERLSQKARDLIAYLAWHEDGPGAAEDKILAALWPMTKPEAARRLLLETSDEINAAFAAGVAEADAVHLAAGQPLPSKPRIHIRVMGPFEVETD